MPPLLLPNEPEHVAHACVFLASDAALPWSDQDLNARPSCRWLQIAADAAAHVELMIVRGMFHMERSNDVMRDRAALVR